jgi:hypothetical protein
MIVFCGLNYSSEIQAPMGTGFTWARTGQAPARASQLSSTTRLGPSTFSGLWHGRRLQLLGMGISPGRELNPMSVPGKVLWEQFWAIAGGAKSTARRSRRRRKKGFDVLSTVNYLAGEIGSFRGRST